ncbi:MAG TPA: ABC transporter permease [Vicinamibacterales bacterium]|nr:ABC transporter permease [Vicinamibacterales bacterium]
MHAPYAMRALWDDARFGARLLARTPGFTGAALTTLALGIGVGTAFFSFVDAVFLRPLGVADSDRLVHVHQTRNGAGAFPLSLTDYFHFRNHARSFTESAAHYPSAPLHVVIDGEPLAVTGSVVTAGYFRLLGLRPALGRFFLETEDRVRDRDAVVVVSHAFWQHRLDGSPAVLDRSILINGRSFSVVGVAPAGFSGVMPGVGVSDVWIPSAMFQVGYRYCDAFAPGCTIVQMIARLAPGTSFERAGAELDALARQLEASHPATNATLGARVVPARGLSPAAQQETVTITGLLLAGAAMVLLVTCANVGGLLLVRGVKRRREIAIRLALGAGRWRVVRQLFTETTLLAAIGGALGLLVATWGNELLRSFYSTDYAGRQLQFDVGIRGWILATTAGLSLLAAVLSGVAPAVLTSATNVVASLKATTAGGSARPTRVRDGLVVAQIACAMALLAGAGLLVRSLQDVARGPGVDTSRIILLRLRPSLVAYDGAKARAFQEEVIRRLELLPGVEAASAGESLPILAWSSRFSVTSELDGTAPERLEVGGSRIGDRYFEVIGTAALEGREFERSDRTDSRPVAIVNDVLARQLWPGERVVGRTLRVDDRTVTIVGVVPDVQYRTINDPPAPYLYLNYWQQEPSEGWSADSRTHVRVTGDAGAMMTRIRREIAAVDPNVPLQEDYPLETRVAFTFRNVRMAMTMLSSFGVLALVLTAVGLYGVVAFATSLRMREISIRLALGARPDQVRRLIVSRGLRLAALGCALGLAGALAGTPWLATMLYGVRPHDPGTFAIAAAILTVVALAASSLPAWRATRVDPAIVLRQE